MEQTTSEFFKNFDLRNSDRKSASVLGNLESNFYLLDTDGHQGVQSPFQGFCQFPEGLTIIGNQDSNTGFGVSSPGIQN